MAALSTTTKSISSRLLAEIETQLQASSISEKCTALSNLYTWLLHTAAGTSPEALLDQVGHLIQQALPPNPTSAPILELTSKVIGLLASLFYENHNSEYFHSEMKTAMQLLDDDREHGRISALYILCELAAWVNDLFDDAILQSTGLLDFCNRVFAAIHDPKALVQEGGVRLLKQMIAISLRRDSQTREVFFHRIFELISEGFKQRDDHIIYGSQLALREVTSQMTQKSTCLGDLNLVLETYEEALKHLKPTTTSSVLNAGISLVPVLTEAVQLLRAPSISTTPRSGRRLVRKSSAIIMRIQDESADQKKISKLWCELLTKIQFVVENMSHSIITTLDTLGKLLLVRSHEMDTYVPAIIQQVKAIYVPGKRGKSNPEAVDAAHQCIARMAQAFGDECLPRLTKLQPLMFQQPLSDSLLDAVQVILKSVPGLSENLSRQVSALFRETLMKRTPASYVDISADDELMVVLRQLGKFDFKGYVTYEFLLKLAEQSIVPVFDCPPSPARTEACLACARLLVSVESDDVGSVDSPTSITPLPTRPGTASSPRSSTISTTQQELGELQLLYMVPQPSTSKSVLRKLLIVQVLSPLINLSLSDPSDSLRFALLKLLNNHSLDQELKEKDNLIVLLAGLYDDYLPVRRQVIAIVGRLLPQSSLLCLSALRHLIMSLLAELMACLKLGTTQTVSKSVESSLREILDLIVFTLRQNRTIAQPFSQAFLSACRQLSDPTSVSLTIRCRALDLLAQVCMSNLTSFPQATKLAIELYTAVMAEHTVSAQRAIATRSLANIIQGTADLNVLEAQVGLFTLLLRILKTDQSLLVRTEIMRIFGMLGVRSPFEYLDWLAAGKLSRKAAKEWQQHIFTPLELHERKGTADFYLASSLNALMRVAFDPTLEKLHLHFCQALNLILLLSPDRVAPHVTRLLHAVIAMLDNVPSGSDTYVRAFFNCLARLVGIAKGDAADTMAQICDHLLQHWSLEDPHLFLLQNILGSTCNAELMAFIPQLCVKIVETVDDLRRTQQPIKQLLCLLHILPTDAIHFVCATRTFLPVLAQLFYDDSFPEATAIELGRTAILCSLAFYPSMLYRDMAVPLVRSLVNALNAAPAVQNEALLLLSVILTELKHDYATFGLLQLVNTAIKKHSLQHVVYERVLRSLLNNETFPSLDQEVSRATVDFQDFQFTTQVGVPSTHSLPVQQEAIKAAFNISTMAEKKEWTDWLRRINRTLIKNASCVTIRACSVLADLHPPTARELLKPAFMSCWTAMYGRFQDDLMRTFEQAISTPDTPREIQRIILDLAELADMFNKGRLTLPARALADVAIQNRSLAKALRYKEAEFYLLTQSTETNESGYVSTPGLTEYFGSFVTPPRYVPPPQPTEDQSGPVGTRLQLSQTALLQQCVEQLIEINNSMRQQHAATGVLRLVESVPFQQQFDIESVSTQWSSDLAIWATSEGSQARLRSCTTGSLGDEGCREIRNKIRYYGSLGLWDEMQHEINVHWTPHTQKELSDPNLRSEMAALRCVAAIGHTDFDALPQFVKNIQSDSIDGLYFRAIADIHANNFVRAREGIQRCRAAMDEALLTGLAESFDRATPALVRLQQLCQLEETITYKQAKLCGDQTLVTFLHKLWAERFMHLVPNVTVWKNSLNITRLAILPTTIPSLTIRFAKLLDCNQTHLGTAKVLLRMLVDEDFEGKSFHISAVQDDEVALAVVRHLWRQPDKQNQALRLLTELSKHALESRPKAFAATCLHTEALFRQRLYLGTSLFAEEEVPASRKRDRQMSKVKELFHQATTLAPDRADVWHDYSMMHFISMNDATRCSLSSFPQLGAKQAAIAAIKGFARAMHLRKGEHALQDGLRLLSIWFEYGDVSEVAQAVARVRASIDVDIWIDFIPQLIARMDHHILSVQTATTDWLLEVGKRHPHAVIFPLHVAQQIPQRAQLAKEVIDQLRLHHPTIVGDSLKFCDEMIRVSSLWPELWFGGISDASDSYLNDEDPNECVNKLLALHQSMKTPSSPQETAFQQSFGLELEAGKQWITRFTLTKDSNDLSCAWTHYYTVYNRIKVMLPTLKVLTLSTVSPWLDHIEGLNVAVPGLGTTTSGSIQTIMQLKPEMHVIPSKQRPRRLQLVDSAGEVHQYLLKGQEDPRMDERVMTFLGLINTLLEASPFTKRENLHIRRYSITPLSPDSGLVGWLHNCDVLSALIREHRQHVKVDVNAENAAILKMCPPMVKGRVLTQEGYERLPRLNKIELFQKGLAVTKGDDLSQILWLKSPDSETWVKRRNAFTRSLAVMSMAGYVLGLGDRHLSNIMLHRHSGEICHIDFGDCFEVAQQRRTYPETVPFRLTRTLVRAMEVGGVEGSFRVVSETVMSIMRENKDSLLAVLQAFVYDPLLSWKIVSAEERPSVAHDESTTSIDDSEDVDRPKLSRKASIQDWDERLNSKALKVIRKVEMKLTGTEFVKLQPSARERKSMAAPARERSSYVPSLGPLQASGASLAMSVGVSVHRGTSVQSSFLHRKRRLSTVSNDDLSIRGTVPEVSVPDQVAQVTAQAMDPSNLCQMYYGWMPLH
eukprot:m.129205 g.129205  ORF g.129205 m.129205 type:complete len:2557 (+) comp13887_c1_seq5:70-7740(+)